LKNSILSVCILFTFLLLASCSGSEEEPPDPEKFNILVNVSPGKSGSVNVPFGRYISGTSVELIAEPVPMYKFKEWQGDASGTGNIITVVVNKDKTITAVFELDRQLFTYVPDDNFENALIELGYDDVMDDYVLIDSISGVSSLDISSKNISDLTGIEGFASLEHLNCEDNEIMILDLSNNFNLLSLNVASNNLSNLDIRKNVKLESLYAYSNQLTEIDLTQNTVLLELILLDNQISSLDVSQNTLIENMRLFNNRLTFLDLSNNVQLNFLECYGNEITSLDVSKNIQLAYLNCSNNNISNLILGENSVLSVLYCNDNQIRELDVSNNPSMRDLYCNDNQLSSLNLKNGNNEIWMLPIRYPTPPGGSGLAPWDPNYSPPPVAYDYGTLVATNNPALTCIQVDDAEIATNYEYWEKDDVAVYAESCD